MKTMYVDVPTRSIVDVSENFSPEGGREVNRVSVLKPHRGKGIARRLMSEMLKDADSEGITLWLDINPYGDMDFAELLAWYHRLGCRPCKGRYRRLPQS